MFVGTSTLRHAFSHDGSVLLSIEGSGVGLAASLKVLLAASLKAPLCDEKACLWLSLIDFFVIFFPYVSAGSKPWLYC